MYPSDSNIIEVVRDLYAQGPVFERTIQKLRPYICPFEELVSHVESGASVMDIGCGSGLFLGVLAFIKGIDRSVGFDTSHNAISLATTMAKRTPKPGGLNFFQLDPDAPWPAGEFDTVSMIDVMHHVAPSSQKKMIKLAAAHTRVNGTFIYKDMAMKPFWAAWGNRLHDLVIAREIIHFVPLSHICSWSEKVGLELVHTASFRRFWYVHELAIFRRSK